MRRIGIVFAVLLLALGCALTQAAAQDVFSSGGEGGGSDTFNSGGGSDGDTGGGSASGGCTGIDQMILYGRCVPRPLPGMVGCQPYYNSYQYFVQKMMEHLQVCEMRGNQVWCHALKGGTCNPELGGRPEWPLVDTGTRYTPDCQQVCASGGGGSGDDGGEKTLKRAPVSPSDGGGFASGPTGDGPRLLTALTFCFTPPSGFSRLPYYRNPQISLRASNPQSPQAVRYTNGIVTIDPKVLARQPKQTQVFLLSQALADHVQILRAQAYGPNYIDDRDTIVGFLDRCLMDEGHVAMPRNNSPDDPRILYGNFAKADWRSSEQVAAFARGFQEWPLVPTSLLPPQ